MFTTFQKLFHGSAKLPWFTIGATGLLSLAFVFMGPGGLDLIYDRTLMNDQPWRLLTAHIAHLNFQHFAWNVGTFAVMSYMLEKDLSVSPLRQASVMLFSAFAINGLLLADPSLGTYAGLSGVLNGMLALMIFESWRQTRSASVFVVAALSVAKIIYEATTGNTLFVDVPWPAAAEGHAGGFIAGLVYAVIERWTGLFALRKPSKAPYFSH